MMAPIIARAASSCHYGCHVQTAGCLDRQRTMPCTARYPWRSKGRSCRGGHIATTAVLGGWKKPLPPLHKAASRGDVRELRRLLESGTEVDVQDWNGSTALMHAAEKKKAGAVQYLLQSGASANVSNKWGFTPVVYAAKGGDTLGSRKVLRLLMPTMGQGEDTEGAAASPSWMRMGSTDESRKSFDEAQDGSEVELGTSAEEVADWMRTKASDTRETWTLMLESSDEVEVGGQVIAGKTAELMGVVDGQRYRIESLFYRPRGDFSETESRISVLRASEPSPSGQAVDGEGLWELWAELSSSTWMVPFETFRLRSVGAELKGSLAIALGVSLFWLGVLPAVVNYRFAYVPSESMAPTLHAGDLVLAERNPTRLEDGDIVLFQPPPLLVRYAQQNGDKLGPRDKFIKRVVGLPGDTVRTTPGAEVFINGTLQPGLTPPSSCQTCKPPDYEIEQLTVPPGQLLVLGDNRGGSADSHVWGYLPRSSVEGRVFWRLLPAERFLPLGRSIVMEPTASAK